MRLLLTRPEPAATETRARLEASGHTVMQAPLLHFAPAEPLPNPEGPFQAVLATSGNAVRAIAASPLSQRLTGLPLLAVGARTADIARAHGFDAVAAAGTGQALARLAKERLKADGPAVLVLEPRDRACDLAGDLKDAGFRVERAIVYAMEKVGALPLQVSEAFGRGGLDGVLLYSRRTAEAFADGWRAVVPDQHRDAARPVLYCLSPAVAAEVRSLGMPVETAPEPTEDALFGLLADR